MFIFQADLVGIFLLMICFTSVISRRNEASILHEESLAGNPAAPSVKSSHQTTTPPPFSIEPKLPETPSSVAPTPQNLSAPILGGSLNNIRTLLKFKKLRKFAQRLPLIGNYFPDLHHHHHPHHHHHHHHPHPHHHSNLNSPHETQQNNVENHQTNGNPVSKPLSHDDLVHAHSQTPHVTRHIHNEFQLPDFPDSPPPEDDDSSSEEWDNSKRRPMTNGLHDIQAHNNQR